LIWLARIICSIVLALGFTGLGFTGVALPESLEAAPRARYLPDRGAPILSGNITGEAWLNARSESRIAFCHEASAAFRGSPSQSYTISWNVQSLTAAGLCDRIDQYYAQEENLDTRISAAAAIAPLLYADIPLTTSNYE
jgi:hypothetical protein